MSVVRHRFYNTRVERHATFVPALAGDGDRATFEIDITYGKRLTLRRTYASAVEQPQDRTITQAEHGVIRRQ